MTRTREIRDVVQTLVEAGTSPRQRRLVVEKMDRYNTIGETAFWTLQSERDNEKLHDLDGWPECACTACGCSEHATCTDDSGVEVCAACSDYTVDDDGEVHC